KGKPAGNDPWEADTLEWSICSPPPNYSHHAPPIVEDRHPLWAGHTVVADPAALRAARVLEWAPATWRATLSTDPIHARPESIQPLAEPSYTPAIAAAGVLVAAVGILVKAYLLATVGTVFFTAMLIKWLWPDKNRLKRIEESTIGLEAGLPIFTTGPRSTAWWGTVCTIACSAMAFSALAYSYFYLRLFSAE